MVEKYLLRQKGEYRMGRRGDNIHKRKDGRWEGRYQNGFKTDGSKKYSSVYAHSYSECKNKLIKASQNTIKPSCLNYRFLDILRLWLITNEIKIKGSTRLKYENIINKHILPSFGNIKLSNVDAIIINSFLQRKLTCGNLKDDTPLSSSYVRTMAIIIEAALNFAVTEGLCTPLKSAINKPPSTKSELIILSKETELLLTSIITNNINHISLGILLALLAGLRIGEVCALQWEDINFENNTIHIKHTITRVPANEGDKKNKLILGPPKTISSDRIIPMPTLLKRALSIAFSKRESSFVVSNKNSFISPRTFDYQYKKWLSANQIKCFNFHVLRHTYATRCAESGMDAKTLSCLLGHSSPTVSLKLYVHPSVDVILKKLDLIYCSA